ncbi:hypothetical protein SLEP1_g14471 [Rubroshorea leprosula]|uniref:PGG domain-containing protein n=1 Tax=Rubroshorea leprosula TaxID=152421 RepID=A0AAV5IJ57_9ROSI|nr:hypothetical protein SLEP1_g14471 [Rubroshorea leprosula]
MDRYETLYEAVRNGDTDQLKALIDENPAILEESYFRTMPDDTVLHAAALFGQINSVKEILERKSDWIKIRNKDGLCAIHIASAKGSVEIVRMLLEKDREQSQLRSTWKERTLRALHFAVLTENEDVLRELTMGIHIDQFVSNLMDEEEPILHFALENNRIEAFKLIQRILLEKNIEAREIRCILNNRDDEGNTVLHTATERRQLQVLKILLLQDVQHRVDVNAQNGNGSTALDIFYDSQGSVNIDKNVNKKIRRMLEQAGAVRREDIINSAPDDQLQQDNRASSQDSFASKRKRLWNFLQKKASPIQKVMCKLSYSALTKEAKDMNADTKNALMVVAVLIANITYQAVLSPPGGFKQSPVNHANNRNHTQEDPQHFNGMAAIASDPIVFGFTTFLGVIGFLSSMLIIFILTSGFPLNWLLRVAVGSLCLDFVTSLLYIAPIGFNIVSTAVLWIGIACLATQLFWVLSPIALKIWERARHTRDSTMQPRGNSSV